MPFFFFSVDQDFAFPIEAYGSSKEWLADRELKLHECERCSLPSLRKELKIFEGFTLGGF